MSARRDWSVLLLVTTLLLPLGTASAGGGEDSGRDVMPQGKGGKALAPQASVGAPRPLPPGTVASPQAVRDSGAADLLFGEPVRYHNLTIVPVATKRQGPFQRYTLMESGLRDGTFQVREMAGNAGAAQVNQIEVRNAGHHPVYLLGGEMILGGKQDRIIQQDGVISASGKWTQVPVFCVERGRWEGQNMQFSAGGAVAHVALRSAAMSGSQSEVWAEVAKSNLKHGTQSQTDTYRRTIQNEALRGKIEPYRKQVLEMLPADAQRAGFIFAINGQIRVVDLFGNPVLFKDLQEKLLSSYILEALGTQEDRAAPALSKGAAESWLLKARAGKKAVGKSSGQAVNYRKESPEALGMETIDAAQAAPVRETYIRK